VVSHAARESHLDEHKNDSTERGETKTVRTLRGLTELEQK
jgi:hypothetical protein